MKLHDNEKAILWAVFIGIVMGVCSAVLAFIMLGKCI
jgi:hypothetical protein